MPEKQYTTWQWASSSRPYINAVREYLKRMSKVDKKKMKPRSQTTTAPKTKVMGRDVMARQKALQNQLNQLGTRKMR